MLMEVISKMLQAYWIQVKALCSTVHLRTFHVEVECILAKQDTLPYLACYIAVHRSYHLIIWFLLWGGEKNMLFYISAPLSSWRWNQIFIPKKTQTGKLLSLICQACCIPVVESHLVTSVLVNWDWFSTVSTSPALPGTSNVLELEVWYINMI